MNRIRNIKLLHYLDEICHADDDAEGLDQNRNHKSVHAGKVYPPIN